MNKINRKLEKYNIDDDNKFDELYRHIQIKFVYNKKYITFYLFVLIKTYEIMQSI